MGKEKYPTIVLEAVADHNLWFWHTAFGFVGSSNDINILDANVLHKCFVDRTHLHIDFNFCIGNDHMFLSCQWHLPTSFTFYQNNLCPHSTNGEDICWLARTCLQRC